ncbi:hypothetical protein RHMOL_Rhmol06G0171300 [Rhododendron molle]|uniref:Uncharacterized protein n=1 Tax=Rhododendron molle TaxID=49168 RepID=A0ACC0ND43_RHOML|nr:hypothetical protein RHMOL_Rhmol06G0171300 [Rhododendron molle]
MARCFLLYLLSASLPNRRNRAHLSLLPALRDSERSPALTGELWTYEVIGMYPPETKCPDDTILPRALRWSAEYKGVKRGRGKLDAFRLYLDELHPDQVHWRVWDRFEITYVAQSREVSVDGCFESPLPAVVLG